jgi:glycosyltransferase involved in cell wall biosynthesis
MRPIISRAAVCVVPLRIGSGTRFKILEAAAMGRAVVSTTVGAEGLEFEDGKEIIIADEPGQFASSVAGLLRNRGQRQQMGTAAHLKARSHYSLPVLQAAVRTALERLPVAAAAVTR